MHCWQMHWLSGKSAIRFAVLSCLMTDGLSKVCFAHQHALMSNPCAMAQALACWHNGQICVEESNDVIARPYRNVVNMSQYRQDIYAH